jgi:hypothetical protein
MAPTPEQFTCPALRLLINALSMLEGLRRLQSWRATAAFDRDRRQAESSFFKSIGDLTVARRSRPERSRGFPGRSPVLLRPRRQQPEWWPRRVLQVLHDKLFKTVYLNPSCLSGHVWLDGTNLEVSIDDTEIR